MRDQRRLLWFALVGLAIGAALLHLRIHPPGKGPAYVVANVFCWMDAVLVSLLFLSRGTAVWGLLLNSFMAFLGMILMADFALTATAAGVVKVKPGQDLLGWLLQTTFPDITILFGDFMVGLALYKATVAGTQATS
jgi:hypothetical protein